MSTTSPTEENVMIKDTELYKEHEKSPKSQQAVFRIISTGINRRPTRRSEMARERRRMLVGVCNCLIGDKSMIKSTNTVTSDNKNNNNKKLVLIKTLLVVNCHLLKNHIVKFRLFNFFFITYSALFGVQVNSSILIYNKYDTSSL